MPGGGGDATGKADLTYNLRAGCRIVIFEMETAMNKLCLALATAGVLAAAGCASVEPNEPMLKANNTLRTTQEYATGSRLAKPTTPHMVKSVGNDEYTQYNEHKSLGNVVGAKGN
jgi:hypothetical protein